MVKTSNIDIPCAGTSLAGTLFRPNAVKAAIMIAPATGIKKTFYRSFAQFLAENGYGVICYDNEGIGDSQNGPVSQSEASLISWGQKDMTAVLDALKGAFPGTTYHLVGHSAGGQLVGLMDNARDLRSLFNVACSSGSLRNMEFPFRVQAEFFMNAFIPASNALFGHTKSQWVGMGEPLPKQVAAQWREWCNGSGYVAVGLGKTIHQHHYDALSIPSRWLYATDDDIANEANVRDMIRVYSRLESEVIPLDPRALGFPEIGHMKFFSSKKKELWEYALEWFEAQS